MDFRTLIEFATPLGLPFLFGFGWVTPILIVGIGVPLAWLTAHLLERDRPS